MHSSVISIEPSWASPEDPFSGPRCRRPPPQPCVKSNSPAFFGGRDLPSFLFLFLRYFLELAFDERLNHRHQRAEVSSPVPHTILGIAHVPRSPFWEASGEAAESPTSPFSFSNPRILTFYRSLLFRDPSPSPLFSPSHISS